ncbi:serine hydrolase domain-containing protein [Rhodococcus qingshengii]|uniref:serine hydrolase domain-containing protein n=1 Tax=Rhodococcus qingshengii TaxID=334542 RepID=UPI00279C45BC|nr:serine hydrolase [Rhodococcus qingshengii]
MFTRLSRAATCAVLMIFTFAAAPVGAAPVAGGVPVCAEPAPGELAARENPETLGMDSAALAEALEFGQSKGAASIQVYRHGCLAGDRTGTENWPIPLASTTKGVASVAVGRAITMGLFSLDDPLRKFFPQADDAHGALTIRQILTQTTGLRFSWPAEVAGIGTDQILQTLNAPIDFAPGTKFQYAQNTLALLPKIIEITAQSDFLDFVQREVFGPVGINRDSWLWLRDRSGNTVVSGGLAMRADDLARLGRLMLQNGSWNGRKLIDPAYVRDAAQPSDANGGYGFLLWTNAGDTHWPSFSGRSVHRIDHPILPGSPRDTYAFSGALGQLIVVVPSRDMVIVRQGIPVSIDPNNLGANIVGTGNPDNQELIRKITASVQDLPPEPADDPYRYNDATGPLFKEPADILFWSDPANVQAILLGTGDYADTGCSFMWCNGKPLPVDLSDTVVDASAQIAAAVAASSRGPR